MKKCKKYSIMQQIRTAWDENTKVQPINPIKIKPKMLQFDKCYKVDTVSKVLHVAKAKSADN
jgi:hypothetical protein